MQIRDRRLQQRRDRLEARRLDRLEIEPRGEVVAEQVARLGASSSVRRWFSVAFWTSSNAPQEPYPGGIGLASSQPPFANL